WAELEVTNSSPSQLLRDVEVKVMNLEDVLRKQDDPTKHFLYPVQLFNPTAVCWSERFAPPNQLRMMIPPGSTSLALIGFSDDSNGMWTVFNAPAPNKPRYLGGARIEVEVSSPDSTPWKRAFYIECHPNYTDGTRARFEFVEWDAWLANHELLSNYPDKKS
ncbi:MAG: hypothetical protein Q7T04_01735, partial [Dehalococcoidia bacterium]|nr:hypothetical protein [Dehalococcoidia bacterium]